MRRSLPISLVAAGCLLASAAPATAQTFKPAPTIQLPDGAKPQAVVIGDFDSDGKQDLAIADYAGNAVHVRLGNGDGTFRGDGKFTGLVRPEDIAVADLNADGNEDLTVAARTPGDGDIGIAPGAGTGAFTLRSGFDLPGTTHAIAVGDYDGDARTDLAMAAGNHVSVKFNVGYTGVGSLDVSADAPVRSVASGDFTGNGSEDIAVLLNGPSPRLLLLPSKGGQAFDPATFLPLANPGAELAVGDLDADAREDVVVAIPGKDRVVVRLGKGDGTLREGLPDVPTGGGPEALALADIDADGREDLVTANATGDTVSVRLGTGDGRFRAAGEVAVGDKPVDIAVGDVDADGRNDLVVANHEAGTVSVRLGAGVPRLAGNLLVNGGFEQGPGGRLPAEAPNIPGWTTIGGMTFLRYGIAPHFGFLTWKDAPRHGGGSNFLWGGDSTGFAGVTEASQTVVVSGSAAAIDAGRTTATLSADLGGGLAYADNMSGTAEFLDASGSALGTLAIGPVTAADRRNVTSLLRRAGSAPVPVRTRRIRVTLTSRDNDRYSSAIADNVNLTLATRPATSPATPRPAFGADAKVTIRLAARRAPVRVRVANGNRFAVTGALKGRRFALAAGARTTLRLALSKRQRRRLTSAGKVTLRVTAAVTDPAGNRRTVARRVTVRRSRAARAR